MTKESGFKRRGFFGVTSKGTTQVQRRVFRSEVSIERSGIDNIVIIER